MFPDLLKTNRRWAPVVLVVVTALVALGVLAGAGGPKRGPSKVLGRTQLSAIRAATRQVTRKNAGGSTRRRSVPSTTSSTTTTNPGTTSASTALASSGSAASPSASTASTAPTTSTTNPNQQVQLAGGVSWVITKHTMTSGGLSRYYLTLTPQNMTANEKLPVVMVLHGFAVTPYIEVHRTNFLDVTGPAILVYPAGYGESWDAGACCGIAWQKHVNDVAFLNAVLKQVHSTYPQASGSNNYLAGYSNGGKMALMLNCLDPGKFSGVAVYGAVPTYTCPSVPPTSLLEVAGTADPEVNVGPSGKGSTVNGYTETTVVGEVDAYLRADHCSSRTLPNAEGKMDSTIWYSCSGGRRVGLALFQGQTHTWPEGTGATPSAQQVMWNFFTSIGA